MIGAVMRGLADEVRTPKYAHVERERRWLVDAASRPAIAERAHVLIEDRYIRGTRLRLRRMTDSETGERSCKLTKKYEAADPLARPIVTAYLSDCEYELLAALAADVLTKRRYPLADDGLEWSLDCFSGDLEGLELLEIEASDDASLRALSPPAWAKREVTNSPCYAGGTLAADGLPKEMRWPGC